MWGVHHPTYPDGIILTKCYSGGETILYVPEDDVVKAYRAKRNEE